MRNVWALWFLICGLALTGCHCCDVTERYADHIDDISDHKVCLDRWYCERLDLTRLCINSRCCRPR